MSLLIESNRLKIVRLILIHYFFRNLMGKVFIEFKFCWIILLICLLFNLFLFAYCHHHRDRSIHYRCLNLFFNLRRRRESLFLNYFYFSFILQYLNISDLYFRLLLFLLRLDSLYLFDRSFWLL